MLGERRPYFELAHPDGHTVTSGEADLVLNEERLEVRLHSIPPLVFPLVSIVEMDLLSGSIPLVLDSGYVGRLTGLPDPEGFFARMSDGRRTELARWLLRPSRLRIAEFEADVMWSESGWGSLEDVASVLVDQTHTTVIPTRYGAFALPHGRVSMVAVDGGRLRIEEPRVGVEASLRTGECSVVMEAGGAIRRGREVLVHELSDRLGLHRTDQPITRADMDAAEPGTWDRVTAELCSEGCRPALGLVAGLAAPEGMWLAWAASPPTSYAEVPELTAWCLAVQRRHGSEPRIVALRITEPEPDAFVFSATEPMPAAGGDDAEDAGEAVAHLADALGLLAPDPTPLTLSESDLATGYDGGWLWPMHHLEPLAFARRAFLGRVEASEPDRWSRELLELLGRGG